MNFGSSFVFNLFLALYGLTQLNDIFAIFRTDKTKPAGDDWEVLLVFPTALA